MGSQSEDIPGPIASVNMAIVCHEHELRLTISERMKRGRGELEEEAGRGREGDLKPKQETCFPGGGVCNCIPITLLKT